MGKKKDEVLFELRKSRKAFLLEYICGIFLLVLMVFLDYKGIKLNIWGTYLVFGLALFSIASAEVSRLMHRYKILGSKLIMIEGLLKQHKKHIYFYSLGFVPDINVKQGRIQRLLDYGTVLIKGSEADSFEIKDVNGPRTVLEIIEELIEKNKKQE